jgi:hypothetical protein
MNVKDILSPPVFTLWQCFGYGVFVIAGIFIVLAAMRALLDLRHWTLALARDRQRKQAIAGNYILSRGNQSYQLVLMLPSADRARKAAPHA